MDFLSRVLTKTSHKRPILPTIQPVPSASQSTPTRPRTVGAALVDIIPHGYGSDAFVMSPVGVSAPTSPDALTKTDKEPDPLAPRPTRNEASKDSNLTAVGIKRGVDNIMGKLPTDVRRWEKPESISIKHVDIPAGPLHFTYCEDPLPPGWTMHIHPEGKPYYHRDAQEPEDGLLDGTHLYKPDKVLSRPFEILTDSDPRDLSTRIMLEHAHFFVRLTVQQDKIRLPTQADLFLELYPEEEEEEEGNKEQYRFAGYYLVDHDHECVFWAEVVSTASLGAHKVNPGTFSQQHLKLQMTSQYWSHIQCYPLETNVKIDAAQAKLIDYLSNMETDYATSAASTSCWTDSQCRNFISSLSDGSRTWKVARLLALVFQSQSMNLYGHPAARLDRLHSYEADDSSTVTVAVDPDTTSTDTESQTLRWRIQTFSQAMAAVLLRICCLFLFDAPAKHNEEFDKVWVDKIVHEIRFQELMDRTVEDWERFSLMSTVLWTANMAFLAIPSPLSLPPKTDPPASTNFESSVRTASVTTSLTSTVFSVGCITVSLLLIRKHRVKWSAEEAREYLETECHTLFGHRPLAILFALPFAFLIYSILSFSTAVMLFCVTVEGHAIAVTLLTISLFMAAWIIISVWYFWKRETLWKSTVEGMDRLSFRMQFTSWFWGLRVTPERRKTA